MRVPRAASRLGHPMPAQGREYHLCHVFDLRNKFHHTVHTKSGRVGTHFGGEVVTAREDEGIFYSPHNITLQSQNCICIFYYFMNRLRSICNMISIIILFPPTDTSYTLDICFVLFINSNSIQFSPVAGDQRRSVVV